MNHPFFIALQFLTRVPVRLHGPPAAAETARSLLYYPLVGLLLGLGLAGLHAALQGLPPPLPAAVVVLAWVLITGALHLDGLADSADAWMGGGGDRARSLAILKDPRCGTAGVAAVVLVLMLKFSALQAGGEEGTAALVLAPFLGRTAVVALFLSTPYVRPGGLGATLSTHLPRRRGAWAVALSALLALAAWGVHGLAALVIAAALLLGLRALMCRRLGGTTGDTAGAVVELVETALLLVL